MRKGSSLNLRKIETKIRTGNLLDFSQMAELEDSLNEISSHEWESNLAKIICGSLVSLNELIEDISDEDLREKLSDRGRFCIFECFFEPLLYYKNKHNLPLNMPRLSESEEDEYILENPLYSESENRDLNELFRFGKTPKVSIQELFGFVLSVLHFGGFNVSSLVVSVINMACFAKNTRIPICQHNWRPIFVVSLLISDKLWDDSSAKTGDLARTIGFISPKALKYLELIFCEELDWKITFKLDTMKRFISEIVDSKLLDSALIETVISSETYQSYCYEGINDQSTAKCEASSAERLENKNMMNSAHPVESVKTSSSHKLLQKRPAWSPPSQFSHQSHFQRATTPSLPQQPQLQRGVSFHGGSYSSHSQASASASGYTSMQAVAMKRPTGGSQVTAPGFGPHHRPSYPGSDLKRSSAPMAPAFPGRYAAPNMSIYSGSSKSSQVGVESGNFGIGSFPGIKSYRLATSPNSPDLPGGGWPLQFSGASCMRSMSNSNTSASLGSYNRDNLSVRSHHLRSATPDVHVQKGGPESVRLSLSVQSERGRDTSCLSGLKQPSPSQEAVACRMNSVPGVFEQKSSSNFRFVSGAVKRSSSEHSRLNPANIRGSQRAAAPQLPPQRPPSVSRPGRGGEGGFFSMARNKVSSAFSSITRTFGLSPAGPGQEVGSTASPSSGRASPMNIVSSKGREELKSGTPATSSPLAPERAGQGLSRETNPSLQDDVRQSGSAFVSASLTQALVHSNPRDGSSHPTESQLAGGDSSGPRSAAAPTPDAGRTSVPTLGEHHLRALSTDRAIYKHANIHSLHRQTSGVGVGSHRPAPGGIFSNSNKIHEKLPAFQPPSASWTPTPALVRPFQTPASDRLTCGAHANTWRLNVGRGPAQSQERVASQGRPVAGERMLGRVGITGFSKNVALGGGGVSGGAVGGGGRRFLPSQGGVNGSSTQSQTRTAGLGLIDSIFSGVQRMRSSGPSGGSAERGVSSSRPASLQSVSSGGAKTFSIENLMSPLSNLLKGGGGGGRGSFLSPSVPEPPGVRMYSGSVRRLGNAGGGGVRFG